MKLLDALSFGRTLPLPAFVLHPLTAVIIAAVHVYLAAGHLSKLFGGDMQWTHFWKGFGALGGAYVFAALASRGFARHRHQHEERKELYTFREFPPLQAPESYNLNGILKEMENNKGE